MSKIYLQGEVLTAADLNQSFLDLKTLPINPQTSTYTLVVDDLGKVISATGSINIPANVFASGSTVSIFNNSGAVINIIQASGLTLYNASTSVAGNFTLNSRGICSVIFVDTTTAVLTGVGVSVTASGTLQGPVGPAGPAGPTSASIGPAFSVRSIGTQTFASGTPERVSLTDELYDTNNYFSSSRFTPLVAGYYFISGTFGFSSSTNLAQYATCYLQKNGNSVYLNFGGEVSAGTTAFASTSGLIYCNGTTDYIELWGRATASGGTLTASNYSNLSGFLARNPT